MQDTLLYLTKWLIRNASYQNQTLTDVEAADTALSFKEKLDIHSPQKIECKQEGSIIECSYEFSVRISKPKFRGTINYTLPSHSLRFSTRNPTDVRIVMDGETSGYMDLILANQKLSFHDDNEYRRIYQTYDNLHNAISVHPHVSSEGSPCLGGWSGAWSATIVTSNIPALVNVAKSFLNTWTSNDAYWNINSEYGCWRDLPLFMKKALPFTKWLSQMHIWREVASRTYSLAGLDRRCPRSGDWFRFLQTNQADVLEFADAFQDDPEWGVKLFDLFMGWTMNATTKGDTEDGLLDTFKDVNSFFSAIWSTTYRKIEVALNAPRLVSTALAYDSFRDTPRKRQAKPWNSSTASTRSPLGSLEQVVADVGSKLYSGSSVPRAKMNDLYEYHNVLIENKNQADFSMYCCTTEVLNECARYWGVGSSRSIDVLLTIQEICKLTQFEYPVAVDSTGIEQVEAYYMFVQALTQSDYFKTQDSRQEFVELLSDHFAYTSIETYTNTLLNYSTTRLINARDKYKSIIRDSNIGDDTEQNQLSAF